MIKVQDLEMRDYFRLSGCTECNHKCSYKKEVKADLTTEEESHTEKGSITRGAEIGVIQPQAKEVGDL